MKFVGNVHIAKGDATSLPHILDMLAEDGVQVKGPDVQVREYGTFGIDDALELRERSVLASIVSRRAFIVIADGMTSEAQNALLKTLEEPSGDALFVFIMRSPEILLPTLRSRAQILHIGFSSEETYVVDPSVFLASQPARRLEMLKPLLEKGDDDKRDLGSIIHFLAGLERSLEGNIEEQSRTGIEAVYRAQKYLRDRGALVKPLLEQVALLVPVMNTV